MKPRAAIYSPAKSAMQSGRANTRQWVLKYEPIKQRQHDDLMGWVGAGETLRQITLRFDSKQDAIAYCTRHGLEYDIFQPRERRVKPKSYADNFRYNRP